MSAHIRKCAEAISSSRAPTNKKVPRSVSAAFNRDSVDILAQIGGISGRPCMHFVHIFWAKAAVFSLILLQ
jgi:hypothetical protein